MSCGEFDSEIRTKMKHAQGSGAAKLGPMLKKARKKKKQMVMMKKMHPEAGRSSVLAASSPLPSHKPEFVEGKDTVIGLISDTHGVLDHATLSALKARSISTIIHAGDVGDGRRKSRLSSQQVIDLLANETGKAVIAVAGNVDEGVADLPPWHTSIISGFKILTLHICGFPPNICEESQQIIDAVSPHIVIFGHSHVPAAKWQNNILFVNPGSAGPRRFKLPRCVAFLSLCSTGVTEVEFIPVTSLPQDISGLPPVLSVRMESTLFNLASMPRESL